MKYNVRNLFFFVCFVVLIGFVWALATYAYDEDYSQANMNVSSRTDNTKTIIPDFPVNNSKQGSSPKKSNTQIKKRNSRKPGPECPAYLKDRPEEIVFHDGFTLSYNNKTLQPNWVAWVLTRERAAGTEKRANNFQPDFSIKNGPIAYDSDYRRSGYDRGHMCPSADCKHSRSSQNECFLLSNICPQTHELNAGDWNELENKTRKWVNRCDSLYIVCGPIFMKNEMYATIGDNNILVPNQFFKVILCFNRGDYKAIGFIFNNDDTNQPLNRYATSVDEVEKRTGINFFSKLPKEIERKVEASFDYNTWK